MRVKSEIWVQAYMRRLLGEGLAAYIARKGDPHAGAVFIHVDDLADGHWLYGPAPAGLLEASDERRWTPCFAQAPVTADEVRDYLERQHRYDPDIWVIELEDKRARHFLDEQLMPLVD